MNKTIDALAVCTSITNHMASGALKGYACPPSSVTPVTLQVMKF